MLALLVGTLAFFLPHTLLVGVREVVTRLKMKKIDDQSVIEPEDQITRIEPEDAPGDIQEDVENNDERDNTGNDHRKD